MSFEAITAISEAEEQAKRLKAEAQQGAKAEQAAIAAQGIKELQAAEAKAMEEIKQTRAKADEMAKDAARELAAATDRQKELMLESARSRMDKAAALIVERVVNG